MHQGQGRRSPDVMIGFWTRDPEMLFLFQPSFVAAVQSFRPPSRKAFEMTSTQAHGQLASAHRR